MMTLTRFWTSLDELPGASSARHDWKNSLGGSFGAAEPVLKATGKLAKAVTCPHLSGDDCPRRVIRNADGGFRAVCDNSPAQCHALDLAHEDVVVLVPDRTELTKRIGTALSLVAARKAEAKSPVWHLGDRVAANGARVPVYFAIVGAEDANKTSIFEPVIAGLQPSLLLVPTAFTLSEEQSGYLAKSSVIPRPVSEVIAVAKNGSFSATPLAEQLFGDMESNATARTSNAPRRAWQLPPGTEWPKVTISFVADAVINVKCGKNVRRLEPDDLGMKDGRNGQPSSLWELLKLFAGSGGFLAHRTAHGRAKLEKKKQLLCQRLNEAFGMDGEPITVERDGYRCQFVISAADLSQGKQGQVSRKFGTARK
jgi:hypothetical protein